LPLPSRLADYFVAINVFIENFGEVGFISMVKSDNFDYTKRKNYFRKQKNH
jgi:hypothetical protein